MKSFIIAVCLVSVSLLVFNLSCTDASASREMTSKEAPSKPLPKSMILKKMGFSMPTKIDENSYRDYYMKNYGLTYISWNELQGINKARGWISHPSTAFNGVMPDSIVNLIADNYNKIKNEVLCYKVDDGSCLTDDDNGLCLMDFKKEITETKESYRTDVNLLHYLTKEAVERLGLERYLNQYAIVPIAPGGGNGVFVAAPPNNFSGDPMVFVIVHGGYVILAEW